MAHKYLRGILESCTDEFGQVDYDQFAKKVINFYSLDKEEKKEKEVPFFAIGNSELAAKPKWDGKPIMCKSCGEKHEVEFGESKKLLPDGTYTKPEKSTLLGFTKCTKDGNTYLAVMDGRLM